MSHVLSYTNRLLLGIAVIGVLVAVLYVLLLWLFGAGNPFIIPWIAFNPEHFESLLGIELMGFLIVGIVFVAITLLSHWVRVNQRDRNFGAVAVLLMASGSAFACFVLPFLLFMFRGPFATWEALNTVNINNRIYRLAVYSPDPVEGSWYYHFYECDGLDLFCHDVYTASGFSLSLEVGNFAYDAMTIANNPTSNTIDMRVNGEIVYTHHPQS